MEQTLSSTNLHESEINVEDLDNELQSTEGVLSYHSVIIKNICINKFKQEVQFTIEFQEREIIITIPCQNKEEISEITQLLFAIESKIAKLAENGYLNVVLFKDFQKFLTDELIELLDQEIEFIRNMNNYSSESTQAKIEELNGDIQKLQQNEQELIEEIQLNHNQLIEQIKQRDGLVKLVELLPEIRQQPEAIADTPDQEKILESLPLSELHKHSDKYIFDVIKNS